MTDEELGEYLPWLRKLATGFLHPGHPALDDLVQEGYIAMWKAEKSFDPSRGKLDFWVKVKAHRRMLSVVTDGHYTGHTGRQRSVESFPSADMDILDKAPPTLLGDIEMAYHNGKIAEAIDRLTPAQRRYVYARFWLGLSGKEMRDLGVFGYDPSGLWNRKDTGAKVKLQRDLHRLAYKEELCSRTS